MPSSRHRNSKVILIYSNVYLYRRMLDKEFRRGRGNELADNQEMTTGDPAYPITSLPPKALQAVYHAVTGKTESTEKTIRRNVLIDENSVENLYHIIKQGLDIHSLVCEPTVTISVHHEDDGSINYSSWERFSVLRQKEAKITSSIEIKVETVLRVPGTQTDQRLVIAVGLDSSLPILNAQSKENAEKLAIIYLT